MNDLKTEKSRPWACLLGDISMVRALGKSGIRVAVATDDLSSKCIRSRYCKAVVQVPGWQTDPAGTLSALLSWAATNESAPVLFYQTDQDLIWISRFRDRLAQQFRFVLPPSELVEDLVDKSRFYDRAAGWGIPIPETCIIHGTRHGAEQCAGWTNFPCVLKQITRTDSWHRTVSDGKKALHFETKAELEAVLRKLQTDSGSLVLQTAIPGGEENVVSYHAYVRENLEFVVEFTGRKIRTIPRQYGFSTYVEIADDEEVLELGRRIVRQLRFNGVLKIDFKRDGPRGQLFALEINPRFNLWHHPGVVAGAPIPAAVYWDCVNPTKLNGFTKAHKRVRWMRPRRDLGAFREYRAAGELTAMQWLYQALTVDVNEGFQISDPGPVIHDVLGIFRRDNPAPPTAPDKSCESH